MLGINATSLRKRFITKLAREQVTYKKKTIHIFRMGHVRSYGPTMDSNSNETSSFSSVWGAASLRTGDSEHGQGEEAWRGSGEGWHNGQNLGTSGQGGNIITSSGDRRHDQQINRQMEDVWGRIG